MKAFPHHYVVSASAEPDGEVAVASAGLEPLRTAPPVEFDGPGNRWSPETLLCGALADCFVMTWRAIARAQKLTWLSLDVEVVGTLDRDGGNARFIQFDLEARLRLPVDVDVEAAERALHKAEAGCLISNSLSAQRQLTAAIAVIGAAAA